HGINAPVVVDGVTSAGYQGAPAPDQWFGGPALADAGNIVLRDGAGRVADSLNYGRLVDPWLAEGYQGASGAGRGGCTAPVPAVASGVGTSAARNPDGADTDSNCADFVTTRRPTPGASNQTALDPGPLVSLQLSGNGSSFLRHEDAGNGVVMSDVTSSSPTTLKQDATFVKTAGMADPTCVSFESVNRPGSYLRHENFVLHLQPDDGSSLFAQDATFCPKPGNSGSGTSYQSVNYPTKFIRAYQGAAYLASNGGSNAFDDAASWAADSTWLEATPWAPAP
ncbi:MAG: AbfB domain-containing protein, partial [Propionibacteriales bacterium]|nr:AbfB domain-containing protein [Propionibacteriales bacterium]